MNKQSLSQQPGEVTLFADWIANILPAALGDIEHIETVKQRPWSQVYRIQSAKGITYFKICGVGRQHEVELLQWLKASDAAIVPDVIALDTEKGWMLMADGGIPLRELSQPEAQSALLLEGRFSEEELRDRTANLLTNYANLQQHSLAHLDTLLTMKLLDHRLHRLPDLIQGLLRTSISKRWIDQALSDQVTDSLPAMSRICQTLSSTTYSAALEHGDLHTGNILLNANQLSICDWGDAWITHPFCSLFPLLKASFSPDGNLVFEPNTTKMINAYLEPWKPFAPLGTLHSHFIQALYIGLVLRALNIANALAHADQPATRRWVPQVVKYLTYWVQWSPQIGRQPKFQRPKLQ